MESVLEFVRVNYVWLLIIAVIILFAIVGYIAEKQGFTGINGNKEKKKKELKKEKKVVEEISNENISNEEIVTAQEVDLNDAVAEEELEEITETIDAENESLEPIEEILDRKEDLNIDEDFNQVLEDVEETSSEAKIEIPEDETIEIEEEDIWKF
ncbi:MAG: hypothetical protein E7157_01560 [Lactobacillales bacterium]|nr:hypothetical protein [Lactobacillales bacterium]